MKPLQILRGDCRVTLRDLPANSVNTCVTSPPYFGLRDYGHAEQIGLETSPAAFVEELVSVFREVRRVLCEDGTLWLNLGDSYAGSGKGRMGDGTAAAGPGTKQHTNRGSVSGTIGGTAREAAVTKGAGEDRCYGLKPKDLIGIPWRVALALQADGWYLRQDIIWHKPNPMPESVLDRCTKAHEYIFLLSKSERYHFDAEAIAEKATGISPGNTMPTKSGRAYEDGSEEHRTAANLHNIGARETRNKRSVWTVPTASFKGAHFATFPPDLIRPCILAGCPVGGTVLDCFGGSGTTGQVAIEAGRNAILCELNPEYVALIEQRTTVTLGLAL